MEIRLNSVSFDINVLRTSVWEQPCFFPFSVFIFFWIVHERWRKMSEMQRKIAMNAKFKILFPLTACHNCIRRGALINISKPQFLFFRDCNLFVVHCFDKVRRNKTLINGVSWRQVNPRTCRVSPSPWYKGGGEGCWWNPHALGFCCVTIFGKYFTFSGKPVMCSTRWRVYYGLWRCWGPVTSSKMLDFTQN